MLCGDGSTPRDARGISEKATTLRLWLFRHAKSSWEDAGQRDFDRPLNKRGERDAPRMRDWLAQQQHPATWIWTSTAARALATTQFVAAGFSAGDPEVVAEQSLYASDSETILTVLRSTPPDIENVALVAHNPALTVTVNSMTSATVIDNLPTFGIARFRVPGRWPTLQFGNAELELLTSPKALNRDVDREGPGE